MNTLEKKIDFINFDLLPDLVYSGAKFYCYIINYNITGLVGNYPLDKIIEFIDKQTIGDICYDDYKDFVANIKDKYDLGQKVNIFLSKNEDFFGFLIIETEDSILVHPMWATEISDTIWSCFEAFSTLANNKNFYSPYSESKSSIAKVLKFMPLS